ncbi:hypothetical protein [Streptomyces spinosirectus]
MNVPIRASATAAPAILLTAGPATAPARAQTDLDCSDFALQEDAQAEFNRDPSDPFRLDADADGTACEVLPHRTSPAVTPTATTFPQRGVDAGVGGGSGAADLEVAAGVGLALLGLTLASGRVLLRRRRGEAAGQARP